MVMVAVLVSVSTALVGPIMFLGLLVAHLAYWAAGTNRHVVTVPMAALVAMLVLVTGHTVLAHVLDADNVLSVIIEFLKLRRSASWGVVLVLPTVSVLCACVLVRPTDWQLLWVRSIGFYGMVLLPVSLGVLASLVWRVEHQGSNGLALMSGPAPTWRTVAAKAAAAWLLATVMQLVLVMAAAAVGALVLGLPGVLPSRYLVAGLLVAVACAPVCAVQSGLSAFTRSFAVPVAIGLALTGAGTTALLVHIPAAWLLPHALVTRTTQIGATSDGAALVFAAQDLTWTSAAVTVATGAVLSAVVVLVTSAVLNRVDCRT